MWKQFAHYNDLGFNVALFVETLVRQGAINECFSCSHYASIMSTNVSVDGKLFVNVLLYHLYDISCEGKRKVVGGL